MTDPFDEITALRKNHEELKDLVKKQLATPPKLDINYPLLTSLLSKQMPDVSGVLSAVERERMEIERLVTNVPQSIPIRGDFYGFSSEKPFILYWGVMVLTIFVSAYFIFRSSDNEEIKRLQADKAMLEHEINYFTERNPKLGNKYFK
ncbi:hypothetical protein LV89_04985 [Arcicella aurantiaca]|uniref:Uncharacterized protein n=1 Tax=Arcicella aurantiaca TaxID=591202 RepID=A0A316DE45_9BACT|nr:hypothetical protein [Arcicella aurantiaca]PWK15459.1 hypothetical protein LV89_04985 [Arcicella aurantiaca]